MGKRGWVLRSAVIWHREHALPEAVRDRPRRNYEYVFIFAQQRNYYFNRAALKDVHLEEDVWTISARPRPSPLDTAPYPDELVETCLNLGCPPGGAVLDPFMGSGTTVRVAVSSKRPATGIDLNPEFCAYAVGQMDVLCF
jgi:DNA modification methylase